MHHLASSALLTVPEVDHVADVWDLRRSVTFNTQVIEARWQAQEARWLVSTKEGRQIRCKWFLPATGTSFKQYMPDFKGLDKFKGEILRFQGAQALLR